MSDDTPRVEEFRGLLGDESELSAVELLQEERGKTVVHESRIKDVVGEFRKKAWAADRAHDAGIYMECADAVEELINDE